MEAEMNQKRIRRILVFMTVALALALAIAAAASDLGNKGYAEGEGAAGTGSITQEDAEKGYAEGAGYASAGARVDAQAEDRNYAEGQAGNSGRVNFAAGIAWEQLVPAANLVEVYRFTGVTDDGQQGSSNRKKATSIHCTNVANTNNQVEVQVFQYDGTTVYTGTVTISPNRTFTFSTQATAIYFDDVFLGGGGGTGEIYQGTGRILAESKQLICTAQALDPFNNPPLFVVNLDLYKR
jgi:hypothetical protein